MQPTGEMHTYFGHVLIMGTSFLLIRNKDFSNYFDITRTNCSEMVLIICWGLQDRLGMPVSQRLQHSFFAKHRSVPCYEYVCRLACACIGITTTRAGSDINCNISNSGKRVPKSTHLLDTFAVDMSKINLKRVFEAKNGGIITVLTIMQWEVLVQENHQI